MRDIPAGAEQYTPYGRELMEHKAKLAFDIYQNYYGRKTALAEEFTAQGGQMTPAAAKKIGRQALAETAAELNLKETPGDAPSFGELRRTLKSSYSGSGERRIWERFAKKHLMPRTKRRLCAGLQRKNRNASFLIRSLKLMTR